VAVAETFYEVLKVSPTASVEVIEDTYREQQMKWSRRANNAPRAADRNEATERVELLGRIRRVLLDPVQRARYDASIGIGARQVPPPIRPAVPPPLPPPRRPTPRPSRPSHGKTKFIPRKPGAQYLMSQGGWLLLVVVGVWATWNQDHNESLGSKAAGVILLVLIGAVPINVISYAYRRIRRMP
jgi:DnaJ domain